MTADDWIAFCAVVTLFGGCLLGGLIGLVKLAWTVSQLNLKVDLMWEKQQTAWGFQMRRAATRTVQEGEATMESPLTFTAESIHSLDGMKDELQEWWRGWNHKEDDAATLLEIEKLFGKRLSQLGGGKRSHDSCLLTALAVACNNPAIELKI